MRNIFLEKSYTKCVDETSSKPFYKKTKLNISLNKQSESLFLLYVQTKELTTCFQLT